MTLPDFLIIGAMKAGTTTLYRDLLTNPRVFFPLDKEPENLTNDDVLTEAGRREYAAMFKRSRSDQVCGEASTAYTKLPDIPGVAERAQRVLGEGFKAIYLVREPVLRTISHHYHEWISGQVNCGIDEAVHAESRFIDYSRYAMQITPWLDTLGPQRVLILRLETYATDRCGTVEAVSRFLGIEPDVARIQTGKVYNPSDRKPVRGGPVAHLRTTFVYQHVIRRMLSPGIREKLRSVVLPKAPPRPDPPSVQTVQYIIEQVEADAQRLRTIMGWEKPLWNFNEIGHRVVARQRQDEPADDITSSSSSTAPGERPREAKR